MLVFLLRAYFFAGSFGGMAQSGGMDESNLSSYLVAAAGSGDYIALDAGTLNAGIRSFRNGVRKWSFEGVGENSMVVG